MQSDADAVVIGAGHNGLVAANVLAERWASAAVASRRRLQARRQQKT